jgi:catechol 2,3-dioxygenase-like lactoylglutathione lyase family enzyme
MSYVALVTNRFDEVSRFYGEDLGLPIVDAWDRDNARGVRFDLGGMRLEIIDNEREQRQQTLGEPMGRVQIVIEVSDIDEARSRLMLDAPPVTETSWGSRVFQLHDPDGVPVTYLQWLEPGNGVDTTI